MVKKVNNIKTIDTSDLVKKLTIIQKLMKLKNCLFGAIKLAKNAYTNKYKYSGYCIRFDTCGNFPFSEVCGFGKNVVIFFADMSLSLHVNN